ncbi:L-ascorbate oxidase [Flavobacterium limnosediminis JC2902]|uniref:L-ascorbate oxidase n=1 Tax=Flavobacterium limnosediminis JC2902 TaxID=1341181 RepID=V6SKN3_9FLAO|nr:multicopper oxidase domain-containing protein [Flavobacterium limnosediminis]ESU27009.1 L-ascorbate oxidase [Flavobacterium limnosediminis JC2902]
MKRLFLLLFLTNFSFAVIGQTVKRYDLHIKDTLVNFTGKTKPGIAINGQIPAPTLEFTEGDTTEIHVHNHMHHETSLHWHGLILPNEMDGVPYLTTAPIKSHSEAVYRFPIVQNGTYWYHSHTMLQEQIGMYGALIIHKKEPSAIKEKVVLLSDWSDENPNQIERSLHQATDWYAIKKGATQNYAQAIKEGHFTTKLENEWKRMMAMDVSDVYYENFLVNGRLSDAVSDLKPGEKIRLRVINGSASTYFWLQFAGGKMEVVASDGADVKPVAVDRLIVGVSESYDILITMPEKGSYEFLATSEDRTGSVSLWLGEGNKMPMKPMKRLQYFEGMKMMNDMMTVGGKMNDMGMNMSLQQMDMNAVMYPEITGSTSDEKSNTSEESHHNHKEMSEEEKVTLNYNMLQSVTKSTLPDAPFREFTFELTGNMNRYIWTMDNKTISEEDKILIKKGENIRITLKNNSMMRHPMHLHGHFFRIVNEHGDYSPLKNVMDIMPMETNVIEFHASEDYGDWYFHCHILYHMMSGMGKIFSYENSPLNPELGDPKKALRKVYADDRRFYLGAEIGLESNSSDGEIRYSNTRWMLQTEWHVGFQKEYGYENELRFGRLLGVNQFLMPYVGWDFRYRPGGETETNVFNQTNTKDKRSVFSMGLQYTLPWFIVTDGRIDTDGKVRVSFSRDDIPVTERLRLRAMWNTDKEWTVGAKYIFTKYWAVSTHYDSDMRWGAGITFQY